MKKTAVLAAAAVAAALLAAPATPAGAEPLPWDKTVKCKQEDWAGRTIPTRVGNRVLGWKHFSRKHNIKKCQVVNGPLNGLPDKVDGARLVYEGVARNGTKKVTLITIVQYARRTKDRDYDAGKGKKIGVITAYCRGRDRCPDWVND
ncbi:hypothetical protein [Streptomyces jumonjinensis]|uniref:hypothetical protein n=1 Tax=Streptomyces jumonjinensis TaxID=1945 RepID=UPI0037B75E97